MAINDGAPAFPGEQGLCPDGTWNQSFDPGMSLRDYFAAKAMASYIAGDHPFMRTVDCEVRVAEFSYLMADAMLAERAKAEGKS